jgi:adenylate cyclase
LQAAETVRSSGRPTSDLTAYDLYLRALPLPFLVKRQSIGEALDLLGRAIDRDQRYGPALALAAFCHSVIGFSGWGDFESERREGNAVARRALECAGDDPNVIAWAASLGEPDENTQRHRPPESPPIVARPDRTAGVGSVKRPSRGFRAMGETRR